MCDSREIISTVREKFLRQVVVERASWEKSRARQWLVLKTSPHRRNREIAPSYAMYYFTAKNYKYFFYCYFYQRPGFYVTPPDLPLLLLTCTSLSEPNFQLRLQPIERKFLLCYTVPHSLRARGNCKKPVPVQTALNFFWFFNVG